jgi:hypothetical protein
MREKRIKLKGRIRSSERSDRGDYNFAVATIALMLFFLVLFFLVAGSSAWIFGNSGAAAVNPPAHSSIH